MLWFKANIKNNMYFFPVECDTWLYYFWLWEECTEIFSQKIFGPII